MRIKRITVEGGLWDGADITFHPHCNVIMGERLSGKSTLLNLIYYAGLAANVRPRADMVTLYFQEDNEYRRNLCAGSSIRAQVYKDWGWKNVSNEAFNGHPAAQLVRQIRATPEMLTSRPPIRLRTNPNDPGVPSLALDTEKLADIRLRLNTTYRVIETSFDRHKSMQSAYARIVSHPAYRQPSHPEYDRLHRDAMALKRKSQVALRDIQEMKLRVSDTVSRIAVLRTEMAQQQQAWLDTIVPYLGAFELQWELYGARQAYLRRIWDTWELWLEAGLPRVLDEMRISMVHSRVGHPAPPNLVLGQALLEDWETFFETYAEILAPYADRMKGIMEKGYYGDYKGVNIYEARRLSASNFNVTDCVGTKWGSDEQWLYPHELTQHQRNAVWLALTVLSAQSPLLLDTPRDIVDDSLLPHVGAWLAHTDRQTFVASQDRHIIDTADNVIRCEAHAEKGTERARRVT